MKIKTCDIDKKLLGLKINVGGIETRIKAMDLQECGTVFIHLEHLDKLHCGIVIVRENQEIDIYGSADDRDMPQSEIDKAEEDAHEQEVIV